jgi:hypothetical protein
VNSGTAQKIPLNLIAAFKILMSRGYVLKFGHAQEIATLSFVCTAKDFLGISAFLIAVHFTVSTTICGSTETISIHCSSFSCFDPVAGIYRVPVSIHRGRGTEISSHFADFPMTQILHWFPSSQLMKRVSLAGNRQGVPSKEVPADELRLSTPIVMVETSDNAATKHLMALVIRSLLLVMQTAANSVT